VAVKETKYRASKKMRWTRPYKFFLRLAHRRALLFSAPLTFGLAFVFAAIRFSSALFWGF
jgi:hypothetical protein